MFEDLLSNKFCEFNLINQYKNKPISLFGKLFNFGKKPKYQFSALNFPLGKNMQQKCKPQKTIAKTSCGCLPV